MSEFKYLLSAVAIMKYENDYAPEWVAYHYSAGVDHFYIFDNDFNSGLDTALKPFIDEGIVTLIPMPGTTMMFHAYNQALSSYKMESKYIAYIDTDEFIMSELSEPISKTVDHLFKILSTEEIQSSLKGKLPGGIGINWKMFGTSNHKTKPSGLILENYLYRGSEIEEANKHIKTIVNPRVVRQWSNPHFPVYSNGYYNLSQDGKIIHQAFYPEKSYSPLRIHHYFYKSEEEFMVRLKRKKADINISDKELKEHIERSLKNSATFNQIYDKSALKFVPRVKEELTKRGYSV